MADHDANHEESARAFYEFAIWKLTEQNRSIESIERKIAAAIATWSILLVLMLGLFTLDSGQDTREGELSSESESVSYLRSEADGTFAASSPSSAAAEETQSGVSWTDVGVALSIVLLSLLFLAAVFCAYQGFRTRQWKTGPSLAVTHMHAERKAPSTFLFDIGGKLEEAQKSNNGRLKQKGKWCDRTLALSLVGVILSLALALGLRLIH